MKIDGSCHCGQITYEAEIDPEQVEVCHCTDCQSFSGSAFRVGVPVPADKFSLSGEPTIYVKTTESGARYVQTFCPDADRRFTEHARMCHQHRISLGSERSVSATDSRQKFRYGVEDLASMARIEKQ